MALAQQPENTAPPLISFRDLVRILRRHWVVVVVAPLVGILLAATWAALQTPRYTSTTSALVSIAAGDTIGTALTADNLAKSKTQQYAQLGNSRAVAETAVQGLTYELSPGEALAATRVEASTESALLTVQADGTSPERARELSSEWTKALGDRVTAMESGSAGQGTGAPSAGSIVDVQVLSDADLPTVPSSPNTPLALALGALGGLLAGLAYALVRHLLDNRIRSAAAIEDRFGLSILGTIPKVNTNTPRNQEASPESRILVDVGGHGPAGSENDRQRFHVIESLKELRTNIEFIRPDSAPRVITMSSAHPGEGKSTVAANLALTLAQADKPVVLIDGDLRRPALARSFGLVEGIGVTDVMLGQATAHDVMQYVPGVPSFALIGAGRIPPNPSEIIGSDRFRAMVEELARAALVIIDAPPLLPVTDAAILARRFDGCLLVVNAGRPTVDEMTKAVSSIQKIGGEVLGVVLNRVPTTGPEATSYQYYGKSYYTTGTGDVSDPANTR